MRPTMFERTNFKMQYLTMYDTDTIKDSQIRNIACRPETDAIIYMKHLMHNKRGTTKVENKMISQ